MALEGVIQGGYKPPRVVLYAPPGIGKTTFGAQSQKPIFVTTEDGVDNIKIDQFPKSTTWENLLTNVGQVAKGDHDYKTIVLDTLNGATDLCNKHVCDTIFDGVWATEDGGFLSYGRGYGASAEESRRLRILTDECRDRGMMVIMLAHSGTINIKHPLMDDFQKFGPAMQKDLWAVFCRNCDIILRADYDYVVTEVKGTKRKKASTGSTRVLYCEGNAAEEGKSRAGYELPPRMEFTYDVFESYLGKSDSTVTEVRALMVELLSKEEVAGALSFLGVEKLDNAPVTKLKQLLNRLLEKQSDKNEREAAE